MFIDKPNPSDSCISHLKTLSMALILTAALVGCDSNDVSEPEDWDEITDIMISPDSVALEVGEQMNFSAMVRTASGEVVATSDLTLETQWETTDASVFTVEDNGLATAHEPGTAYCTIEASDEFGAAAAKSSGIHRFVGRDSAVVFVF